jgi:hypothetical protein
MATRYAFEAPAISPAASRSFASITSAAISAGLSSMTSPRLARVSWRGCPDAS